MSQGDDSSLHKKSEEEQLREREQRRQREEEDFRKVQETQQQEESNTLKTETEAFQKRAVELANKGAEQRKKDEADAIQRQKEEAGRLREAAYQRSVQDADAIVQQMISASLQTPGLGRRTDSVDRPKPEIFYAIVGRGPAAVINHTTLRQSKWGRDRIGTLRVMHIGFPNPWAKFMEHGMGQPPHLLSLPGFKSAPPNVEVDGGLNSKRFSASLIDAEFSRLDGKYRIVVNTKWVAYVQSAPGWVVAKGQDPIDGPLKDSLKEEGMNDDFIGRLNTKLKANWENLGARYRVLTMAPKPLDQIVPDADLEFVYAAYVDICTGAGRPVVFPLKDKPEPAIYKEARTKPWLPAENWTLALKQRKVLNAVDSIRDETDWGLDERVCVTAGGGVGLNAAERSTNNSCWLDWFGRTSLMDTFNNPRNDTILKHPTQNRRLEPGERPKENVTTDDQIIPLAWRSRFGYGAALKTVAPDNQSLSVTLEKNKDVAAPKIRDRHGVPQVGLHSDGYWLFSQAYEQAYRNPASKRYDRLVIPNGQFTGAVGQPFQFARHLGLTPFEAADGRMLGLDTVDGKVRVLGAAAQNYPQMDRNAGPAAARKMWEYWDSLPVSAVPDGFIFSGANIAYANHFFQEKPNTNLNSMTEDEIKAQLEKQGLKDAAKLAQKLIDGRKRPTNNGYANLDEVVTAITGMLNFEGYQKIRNVFRVDYAPSKDTDLLEALTVEAVGAQHST